MKGVANIIVGVYIHVYLCQYNAMHNVELLYMFAWRRGELIEDDYSACEMHN